MNDASDLAAWAEQRDESAFTRLVERHSGLVAAVCRRQLRDDSTVDEAVQAVFIVLAKRSATLDDAERLSAWLHGVALRVCRHIRHADLRRARREEKSAMPRVEQPGPSEVAEPAWTDLRPHLDEAIASLSATQRQVVIARFLEGLSHASVGARLRISEDSARMRCAYALDKLRGWFKKRGATIGSGVLLAGLASETTAVEPALIAVYAQAALHPAGATGATALAGVAMGATTAKLVALGLAAALTLAGGATLAVQLLASPSTVPTSAASAQISPFAPADIPSPVGMGAAPPAGLAVGFDFEDGIRPSGWVLGRVEAGPPRTGNRFCLAGETSAAAPWIKAQLDADANAALFIYADGMELGFDYWVDDAVGSIDIWVWNESQQAVFGAGDAYVGNLQPQTWNRAATRFEDWRAEDGRQLRAGDRIQRLSFMANQQDGIMCLDNVQVRRPGPRP